MHEISFQLSASASKHIPHQALMNNFLTVNKGLPVVITG
jgi:hypothetical protein